ncbi:NADH-dependent formate dehydrogenase delta subunit FdsD family protein [Collimonas arenae]|uniref:NADH-dependent formate dehydrogenase delta subunit FdsD family protein n=1 Tax=Collimonas arenae TaxID=279058 RepID=A0A127PLX2_9BURK|nr:formate dehydrogenase subunit delta [Collimonas arenae]AMO98782.1 NADH-dependent formate dehydrogenase delta subunit FdsD family protein [Collimonas arenae]AMP08675.1 NADH-dependent formate dehydrogenase delta subunit FdsD family protein [Collimonas arenae]
MNVQHLVTMANQIGSFFETMPDRPQAMSDFANHLKRNWEPRMRRELLQHIEQQGGSDLNGLVLEALRLHGSMLK